MCAATINGNSKPKTKQLACWWPASLSVLGLLSGQQQRVLLENGDHNSMANMWYIPTQPMLQPHRDTPIKKSLTGVKLGAA
jgi:hypothetical protein